MEITSFVEMTIPSLGLPNYKTFHKIRRMMNVEMITKCFARKES
jgi:hypothetical protein